MSTSRTPPLLSESRGDSLAPSQADPTPSVARRFIGCDTEHLPPNELTAQIEAAIRSRMTFASWPRFVSGNHRELMDDYAPKHASGPRSDR